MMAPYTSFAQMFSTAGPEGIARVVIPMFQRDYAQGRDDAATRRVRDDFLDALHAAVTGGAPLSLDFVYGSVAGETLTPLDGQQRLTTLFLLHAYLASRAGVDARSLLSRFRYETRVSARAFGEALAQRGIPDGCTSVREAICDQPWFLSSWAHDPTVRAMLVTLEAIHDRFGAADASVAWARLTEVTHPAVGFHLLDVKDLPDPDTLYIRMNSRGRSLTPFEVFKARFEGALGEDPRRAEFAGCFDGAWSDLLWPLRGDDNLIDDEFMRCVHFVTDVCDWRAGVLTAGDLEERAMRVFCAASPSASQNLDLLLQMFNVWCATSHEDFFRAHLSANQHTPGATTLFAVDANDSADLFAMCCRHYGTPRFSLQRTLLLYAALLHRVHTTADVARRLRVLRNVTESSRLEAKSMPAMLAEVEAYVKSGDPAALGSFPRAQVQEERAKEQFLPEHPTLTASLHALEDHALLRGCLAAFTLDAAVFEARATAFVEVFGDPSNLPAAAGAMLACGDYAQQREGRGWKYGTHHGYDAWRTLFDVAGDRSTMPQVLGTLLDHYAAAQGAPQARLTAIADAWRNEREQRLEFGWRYYAVKYPVMRESRSGNYVFADRQGFSVCMLHKVRLSGDYRDPYLLAMLRQSGAKVPDEVIDPWFSGYETSHRWLRLQKSQTGLRVDSAGIHVDAPRDPAHLAAFNAVCAQHGIGDDHTLNVPQSQVDDALVDTVDRVSLGAALLRDLIAARL
ncbi:MAG: DUF262 domain-containing protein [Polyangiales bacterium]